MSAWTLYWILKLDDIRAMFSVGSIIAACGVGVALFVYKMGKAEDEDAVVKAAVYCLRRLCPTAIVCAVLWCFLPSTKQMAVVAVLPPIMNSKFVQDDLPADARKLYEAARDGLLEMAGKDPARPEKP